MQTNIVFNILYKHMFNIALKIVVANYNFSFMLKPFVNYNFILFEIVFTDGEGAWGQWSSCLHWDFRIFFIVRF